MQGPQDHTIVMGASMAGFLAACVLPEHYQRVTVTEPDVLASRPFLDGHVRALVRELPRVGVLERCPVARTGPFPVGGRGS